MAGRLGWRLWDRRLTGEIARLANCPKGVIESREERNDPLYYRLFKSFLRGSYEGSINAPKLNLAPREDKVTRLLARGKSEKDAEELVDSVDRDRADFIEKYFNVERPDRATYHSTINTALGEEAVVQMILRFKETWKAGTV